MSKYIHPLKTKIPLSGLCALGRCGLACCGRHGEQHCAPGAGKKPVALMPLSGLCALGRCGLACCGRHGETIILPQGHPGR